MKNISFKFYSVLKNEDAIPYIGGNLLVAADGLGGSGSAVHQIDRAKHTDMHKEIWSGAFGDISTISRELSQYIEELIAPMIDGKDDTSALWASRIVIARCVYALTEGEFRGAKLDDEKVRAALAEFIGKGLHYTVKKFDLKNGKYANQLLLPTTLAFIRYMEGEDSVIAETVWSGDSRLYALTSEGLKILSVDDEDDSGAITNLFYADNQKIHLHYLRHEIQKPCILMAVSDGVFDPFAPYDSLGAEHTLLSAIDGSNCEQDLADKLHGFFDSVHGDDATMAFASFGFADFADMKKVLKARTDKILSVRQRQAELYPALEVLDLSEEEAAHYVTSRTKDRYDYIIPIILDAIERGIYDVVITEKLRSIADAARKAYIAELETAKKKRRETALAELNRYVLTHPELVVSEILNPAPMRRNDQIAETYTRFKRVAEDLVSELSRLRDAERRLVESNAKKQILHGQIQAKIAEYRKHFDDMWDDQDQNAAKNRGSVLDILYVWSRIDNSLKFGWGLQDIGKLPAVDRELAYDVQAFNSGCRTFHSDINSCRNMRDRIRTEYELLWKRLFEYLRFDERLTDVLLSPGAIHKFGFDGFADNSALAFGNGYKDGLLRKLKAREAEIVPCIVQALADGCDSSSVIDAQYSATKLDLFRTYYRLRNNPADGVKIKEFEKELLALEAEYTSLVDHAKL